MTSTKQIQLTADKPYDYKPIPKSERRRLTQILSEELLELVNRFDGPSHITISIKARGNA